MWQAVSWLTVDSWKFRCVLFHKLDASVLFNQLGRLQTNAAESFTLQWRWFDLTGAAYFIPCNICATVVPWSIPWSFQACCLCATWARLCAHTVRVETVLRGFNQAILSRVWLTVNSERSKNDCRVACKMLTANLYSHSANFSNWQRLLVIPLPKYPQTCWFAFKPSLQPSWSSLIPHFSSKKVRFWTCSTSRK